jgi:DNA-binding phage protein
MLKTTKFDPARYLTTAEERAVFLAEAKATGDADYIAHARTVVERARRAAFKRAMKRKPAR